MPKVTSNVTRLTKYKIDKYNKSINMLQDRFNMVIEEADPEVIKAINVLNKLTTSTQRSDVLLALQLQPSGMSGLWAQSFRNAQAILMHTLRMQHHVDEDCTTLPRFLGTELIGNSATIEEIQTLARKEAKHNREMQEKMQEQTGIHSRL